MMFIPILTHICFKSLCVCLVGTYLFVKLNIEDPRITGCYFLSGLISLLLRYPVPINNKLHKLKVVRIRIIYS